MRLAALLLLGVLTAHAQTGQPKEFSTIEGRVVNTVTGEPVRKAAVTLIYGSSAPGPDDWLRNYSTVSAANGTFTIPHIASGKYRLQVKRNGFLDLEYGARSSRTTGTVLDLEAPDQLKDMELRLIPYGILTGRIVDADGDPVAWAQLQLLKSHYSNGKKTLAMVSGAVTNDLGEYRAVDLAPGRYYLYAMEMDGPPTLDRSKEQYLPVYYPGVTDSAGAVPVDVVAGGQLRLADLMLVKTPVVTAKGKVVVELTGVQGLPRVGFRRDASHDTSMMGRIQETPGIVSASGEFVARGLTPGTYFAAASIVKGGVWQTSPLLTLNVGDTNVEGLVFTIGESVSMTGRIRVDGDTKLDWKNVRVKERAGGPDHAGQDWTNRVGEDGMFKMDNLRPGRYGIVVAGLPDGYYTKAIYLGENEITYTGTEVQNGSDPIDVVVSPKAGLVAGAVRNADAGKPAPGATVVMIPQETERVAIPECYQQAITDQYGRFSFKSVAPGKYKVYAWEDVEPTAWMDSEFMKPVLSKGENVTVEERGRAEVELTVIPANSENQKQ